LEESRTAKRQALDAPSTKPRPSLLNLDIHLHRTPRTPLHNPSIITPSQHLQSKSLSSLRIPEKHAADSPYYDFVVPLKDEREESFSTPLRSPPLPSDI